jgi:hypothetical protein
MKNKRKIFSMIWVITLVIGAVHPIVFTDFVDRTTKYLSIPRIGVAKRIRMRDI